MPEPGTDLLVQIETGLTVASFTDPEEFERLYAKVRDAVAAHEPDVSTATGRAEIASLAYKVARTKTALIAEGKKLTEDWRRKTALVNKACKTIETRMDDLKLHARSPLTEWERHEEARVAKHNAGIRWMDEVSRRDGTAAELRQALADVEATLIDEEWDEYRDTAAKVKAGAVDILTKRVAAAEKAEADAAELARLRAAEEQRQREEKTRLAAEEKKRAEEERVARQRAEEDARRERERQAEERARAEAEAAAQRRIEEAERRAQEAIDKAARDARAREEQAAQEAKDRAEALAAARKAEEAEERRRAADRKHRAEVDAAIIDEFVAIAKVTPAQAKKIIAHIAGGFVPHVTLRY